MTISLLQKKLKGLNYAVLVVDIGNGDYNVTLFTKRNNDFVSSFNVEKDIIYNFKYIGSFEELKKLTALLEEYQDAQN